jgi:hypothetical protein
MPDQTPPPETQPIRISANTILDGQFYKRGEPLPFSKVEDLPPNLKPYVISGELEEEDEEPEGARGSFQLNTAYEVGDDDRLGRRLQRKVAREIAALEAKNEREEWLEEEVAAAGELAPEVAESLEEEHRRHVDMQRAQMDVDSRLADDVSDSAAEARAVPTLYVRRGSRHYQLATKAKLKPGEPVYQRTPAGKLAYVGETTGDAEPELPDLPVQL